MIMIFKKAKFIKPSEIFKKDFVDYRPIFEGKGVNFRIFGN